jgi:hypothetical protein
LAKGTANDFQIHNVAVMANASDHGKAQSFDGAYSACGVGEAALALAKKRSPNGHWSVPGASMESILEAKHITLLKIDIDFNEGALLSVATRLIGEKRTTIDTIVVEYGDNSGVPIACDMCRENPGDCQHVKPNIRALCTRHKAFPGDAAHPRGGDVADIYRLIHELGYSVYRVNIVVNQEIFDSRNRNVNKRMSPTQEGLEPVFFVRSMKKLEHLSPEFPLSRYPEIMRWAVSLLITRERLESVAQHHVIDTSFAGLSIEHDLNGEYKPLRMNINSTKLGTRSVRHFHTPNAGMHQKRISHNGGK